MTVLTTKQLAERLEIRPVTLYAWAEMGKIPSLKLNGAVRFIWEDVLAWMQGQKKGYNEDTLARSSGKGERT